MKNRMCFLRNNQTWVRPGRRTRVLYWLSFFLWFAGCTTTGQTCNKGCADFTQKKLKPRVVFIHPDTKKTITVDVELACSKDERQKGLMHRKSMPENHGMLFVFPFPEVQSFWMKNTFIPLDMIHINAVPSKDKATELMVVGVVENATPHDLSPRSVSAPAKYVLEVNAFFVKKNGIYNWWRVEIIDLPQCQP